MFLTSGELKSINQNLLSHFNNLRTVILNVSNFSRFTRNMKWLGSIEANNSTAQKMLKNDLVIYLIDSEKRYQYSDKDFCSFQYFKPNLPIYPVISSQDNLNCSSCTLVWLLQNWKMYKQR